MNSGVFDVSMAHSLSPIVEWRIRRRCRESMRPVWSVVPLAFVEVDATYSKSLCAAHGGGYAVQWALSVVSCCSRTFDFDVSPWLAATACGGAPPPAISAANHHSQQT